jgi:tetratricopeptide (TPR) repeat protein
MLLLPMLNLASQYKIHDRSQEFMALDYGMNFLNSLEENAIIFTNGDNDTFPLWYNQAVKDKNTKEFIHPAKDLAPTPESQKALQSALEYKHKYLHGIRKDVTVANLSLLNTPWYLRQLRDKEGVIISWPDTLLDQLTYTPPPDYGDSYPMIDYLFDGTAPVDKGFSFSIPGNPAVAPFSVSYPSHPMWRKEGIFRVSDLAVMKIIQDNYGKRPIYFAVTCENYVGFEKYTRNEGMVSRVVSTPGADQLDINRLLLNTEKVYSYRSISDRKVYKDDNMRRLIMNYGAAYDRASSYFLEKGETEKAKYYLDKAFKFISSDFSKEVRSVNLYLQSKQYDEAYKATQVILNKPQDEIDNYLFLSKLWLNHDIRRSYEVMQAAIVKYPADLDLAYFIYDVGLQFRSFDSSRKLLELMKPGVGDIINPYIDSLSMYQNYFGTGNADSVKVK